jgi:hypothetical protein
VLSTDAELSDLDSRTIIEDIIDTVTPPTYSDAAGATGAVSDGGASESVDERE